MSGAAVLASIPSPGSNQISLGPLDLRAYGLLIALGVLAAMWIANRRWVARGHDSEALTTIATWAVTSGIVGARLYHVITDWRLFQGRWLDAFKIWEGGLGIWGAIAGGAVGAIFIARRNGYDLPDLFDSAAPAIPVAQAIGRLGNWFNQELFGRPTDLPWALEIDPSHRPGGYTQFETFHPTFLYEIVLLLAVVVLVLAVEHSRRIHLAPGRLFAVYVAGYTLGRYFVENLRIDTASIILGQRVNEWVSIVVFLAAVTVIITGRTRPPDTPQTGEGASSSWP